MKPDIIDRLKDLIKFNGGDSTIPDAIEEIESLRGMCLWAAEEFKRQCGCFEMGCVPCDYAMKLEDVGKAKNPKPTPFQVIGYDEDNEDANRCCETCKHHRDGITASTCRASGQSIVVEDYAICKLYEEDKA